MAINKVVYDGRTLIDITDSTVDASHLAEGYVAYNASGQKITGELSGGSTIIRDEQDTHGGTIRHIITDAVIEGTKQITSNGTYDVAEYASAEVDVEANLQSKSVNPTESQQTVTPDSNYDGLSSVSVGAISSTYVGTGISRRSSTDLTASGATVTVPSGYYASSASKSVATGTAGTPTATKGTVSNHSISVTPSVTNTTGYITGGTKTGTAVSVSASELVSGTLSITSSGTKDVTNYASASVASGTATAPTSISGTSATVSTGTNTLTLSKTVSVTPQITTSGYISSGTAGNASVSLTANVTTKSATTYTPTTTAQTIASGTYLTGAQTIAGDQNLVSENIAEGVSIFGVQGSHSGGSMHTATITSNGKYDNMTPLYCFVYYNGTRYYTAGNTFQFSSGDTAELRMTAYYSYYVTDIYVNGTLVSEVSGRQTYTYELPDCDIDIELSTNCQTIYVTYKTISITENGSYDVVEYGLVNVDVPTIPIFSVEWNAAGTVVESITCSMTFTECHTLLEHPTHSVAAGAIRRSYDDFASSYTVPAGGWTDVIDGQPVAIYYNFDNPQNSIMYASDGTLSIVDGDNL